MCISVWCVGPLWLWLGFAFPTDFFHDGLFDRRDFLFDVGFFVLGFDVNHRFFENGNQVGGVCVAVLVVVTIAVG